MNLLDHFSYGIGCGLGFGAALTIAKVVAVYLENRPLFSRTRLPPVAAFGEGKRNAKVSPEITPMRRK